MKLRIAHIKAKSQKFRSKFYANLCLDANYGSLLICLAKFPKERRLYRNKMRGMFKDDLAMTNKKELLDAACGTKL